MSRFLLCVRRVFSRRLLWVFAWLVTLLILTAAFIDWYGARALNSYKQRKEAEGDSVKPEAVIPPPVPDDQNTASALPYAALFDPKDHADEKREIDAFASNSGVAEKAVQLGIKVGGNGWQHGRKFDLGVWNEALPHSSAVPVAEGESLQDHLAKCAPMLGQIREACSRPACRFPLHYLDGPGMNLPQTQLDRAACRYLFLEAEWNSRQSTTTGAEEDAELIVTLARNEGAVPTLISVLVEVTLINRSLPVIWENVTERKWDEARLAQLEGALGKVNIASDLRRGVRGERNLFAMWLSDQGEQKMSEFESMMGTDNAPRHSLFRLRIPGVWRSGWLCMATVRIATYDDELVSQFVDKPPQFHLAGVEVLERKIDHELARNNWDPSKGLAALVFPAMSSAAVKCAEAQENVNLARVAIALERYRLANGTLPDSLEKLVSARLLATLPPDCVDGTAPHYRLTGGDKFLLYYNGGNSRDDGGVRAWKGPNGSNETGDFRNGDWTWPMPE